MRVGRYSIKLSRSEKVLFPEGGITKGDLVRYYRRIAEVMLPHLRDRCLTMHRFPEGLNGEGFYQKDIADYFPEWIDRETVAKEGGEVTHVVCNKAATLVYLANQACLTMHVWLSRTDSLDRPDRVIFDLDPPDDDFAPIRMGARRVRAIMEEVGLAPFLMTTGSRGLHVVAPLDESAHFDEVRDFAHRLAQVLVGRHPEDLTVAHRKNKREGKLFLDYLRNSYAQTSVAPYSVRARPGAPVATPLDWRELDDPDLRPRRYHIGNIFRRLGQKRDPWSGIGRHRRALGPALEALTKLEE